MENSCKGRSKGITDNYCTIYYGLLNSQITLYVLLNG
jgi:hypothetical protein